MAGGELVTAIQKVSEGSYDSIQAQTQFYKLVGPLLNPALALGQSLVTFDFNYGLQYIIMPFVGTMLALVFYERVFVASQEFMAEDSEESESGLALEVDSPKSNHSDDKKKKLIIKSKGDSSEEETPAEDL